MSVMIERVTAIIDMFWDAAVEAGNNEDADHLERLYNIEDWTLQEWDNKIAELNSTIKNGTLR